MEHVAEDKTDWILCRYFAYWDVPRVVVFPYNGCFLLLDSPFEEEPDDYRPDYYVWEIGPLSLEEFDTLDFAGFEARRLRQLPDIPVKAFQYHRERVKQGSHFLAQVRFIDVEAVRRSLDA